MAEISFDNKALYEMYCSEIKLVKILVKLLESYTKMKEIRPKLVLLKTTRLAAEIIQESLEKCEVLVIKLAMADYPPGKTIIEHFEEIQKIRDKVLELTKRFNLGK